MRYALVDKDGKIVNVVCWDGQTDWQPPEGLTAIRDKAGEAEPEGTFDGVAFRKRVKPPAPEIPPNSLLALQAELDAVTAQFTDYKANAEAKTADLETRLAKIEAEKVPSEAAIKTA